MSKPKSAGYYGQLNSSSLHKQTRRNPLGRDVCSPVEKHKLVPYNNIKSQTHSRLSEYDGRPTVQVKPSPVNRMVTASAGVQTDLSEVVHPSCRSICHSAEPQTSTVHVSSPRPECLGHRCSNYKLVGSHCLCLPSDGSPSQGDPKNQTMQLHDHCNSPGWPGMPWFWDLLQLSTEIPLQLPVSTTLLKQSHKYMCFTAILNIQPPRPRLVSRSGQLKGNCRVYWQLFAIIVFPPFLAAILNFCVKRKNVFISEMERDEIFYTQGIRKVYWLLFVTNHFPAAFGGHLEFLY